MGRGCATNCSSLVQVMDYRLSIMCKAFGTGAVETAQMK